MDILIAKTETLTVDEAKLSDEVKAFVFNYGMKQMLNDAGANALANLVPPEKDTDGNEEDAESVKARRKEFAKTSPEKVIGEKVALAKAKLDRLYAGDIERSRGEAVDPLQAMAYTVAREKLRAIFRAEGKPYKGFTERTKDEQTAVLDRLIERDEAIMAEAKRRMKVKAAPTNVDLGELGL